MELDKILTFYHVAKIQNVSRAAEHINLTQSAVSRQIMLLERQVGTKLFKRHARGLTLTRHGDILYEIACRIIAEAESAKTRMFEENQEPKGKLKVATTVALASMWLPYYMGDFLESYPDLDLTIIGGDKEPDLSMREADIAIRPYKEHDPNLMQRYLTTFNLGLYASSRYLKKYGTPKTLEDLTQHRLIIFGDESVHQYGSMDWILNAGIECQKKRRSNLKINLGPGLFQMAENDVGIVVISKEYPGLKNSTLVRILPKIESQTKVYYTYPLELKGCKKIEVLYDFLLKKLDDEK